MNTITKNEILAGARLADIYSAEIQGQGWTPRESQAAGPDKLLRVEFQNGELYKRTLPFGRLAKWARTFPDNETFCITFAGDRVTLITVRGGSEITFAPVPVPPGAQAVPPVRFDDDGHRREDFRLVTPADVDGLADAQKSARAGKAFARLRKTEIAAKQALKVAVKEHCERLAILDGGTPAALSRAKSIRAARRELRATLANPANVPPWYPLSREEKRSKFVPVFNPDGTRKLKEFWRDEYTLALGVAEYVGMPPELHDNWFETERVEYMEPVDMRAEYQNAVLSVKDCQRQLAAYKPRKLESTARVSHRDPQRGRKPLLKQDTLAAELKTAQERVKTLLHSAFADECERRGLPRQTASEYFHAAGDYSRARLAIRDWPARKLALATGYTLALEARRKAQGKARAGGALIRARAILDGVPGQAVEVTADCIAEQIEKAHARGAAVEILASNHPAYPVGILSPSFATTPAL